MKETTQIPGNNKNPKLNLPIFRGFTLQLFFLIVIPLTILVLGVAFGSQTLHHDAMRSLVGDRNLRTVRAAANTLEKDLSQVSDTIQILSRGLDGKNDFNSLVLTPSEISATFEGGLALFSANGRLIQSSSSSIDWKNIPIQIPDDFGTAAGPQTPVFSPLIAVSADSDSYVLVSTVTKQSEILVGAFLPAQIIEKSIANLVGAGQTTFLVISPSSMAGQFDILYRTGPLKIDEIVPTHPGIQEVLNGKSDINYFQSSDGEHVAAFSPISPAGWGIIIEEGWEDISNPYLVNTQSAPLILVPVFLLALLAIWFGARRIVTPLQKLEKQAANLAAGDFEAIKPPVGGIEEIRNLQAELIDMAEKLKTAQQTLHNYIGAITAGVESERKSLARELHDDTIQALIALNQRIQLAVLNTPKENTGQMSELQSLVDQTMTNLRRMIRGLRPIYLEDLGLVASLEMLVREIEQSSNLPITFTARGQEHRLDPKSEMSVYRMVQESLNNVVHHAQASQAWVELEFTENRLFVKIRDNGKGFEVPINPAEFPQKGHYGLLGLSERADLLQAELEISSKPGE
ncbi:MAG TPA: histidine kinase, partial [Anaerolineaceae bacterium]|nr:histidine kinase [Anaerolineaceae bacterium]